MERIRVLSSMIRSVGYDRVESMLEIEFCSGSVYQYSNVPQEIYAELMSADSKGGYFEANIKQAGYDYQRVW